VTEQAQHVKITIDDIYREQQEMKQILTRMSQQLDSFGALPDRVTRLEIQMAENAWLPKVVWTSLVAGISGFVAAIWQVVTK
jgi:hypothetical protein